jgi:UDP-glucose 4-epimerase
VITWITVGHKEAVPGEVDFEIGDIRSKNDLERVFNKHQIDAVFVNND